MKVYELPMLAAGRVTNGGPLDAAIRAQVGIRDDTLATPLEHVNDESGPALAADLGVPFYRAWSGREPGRADFGPACDVDPAAQIPGSAK